MVKILLWLKAARAPFFTASIIPVLTGAALSYHQGYFCLSRLLIALIVVLLFHAGSNLLNDYYDAIGSDAINQTPTPFSGGSHLIQQGILTRNAYLKAAWLTFGVGIIIVIFMAFSYHNWLIFGLGLTGVILGVSYSATHTYGMGRGWGELAIGAAFGPFSVLGVFLLQTNYLSWIPFWAGVPIGFLTMGILILNEFPDYQADQTVGKRNWIVRAGGGRLAVWVYLIVISLAYLTVLAGVFKGIFPVNTLYSYFTIPLAIWIGLKIWFYHQETPKIIPVLAGNIGLQFITGLIITLGFWLN